MQADIMQVELNACRYSTSRYKRRQVLLRQI